MVVSMSNDSSIPINLLKKIQHLLTESETRKLLWLSVGVVLMALFEVIGVGAILPFMKIVASPDFISEAGWGQEFFWFVGETHHENLVAIAGFLVLVLIAISAVVKGVVGYYKQKVSWKISADFSSRLLGIYLSRGYDFFLANNSVELKVKLLSEVNTFTTGILVPLLTLISQAFLLVVMVILLIAVNPGLAVSTFFFLGVVFTVIYLLRRKRMSDLGEFRIQANVRRYRSLLELFSGLKTFLVYQVEAYFYNRFTKAADEYSGVQPQFFVLSQIPRLVVEVLLFGGLILITVYLIQTEGGIIEAIPLLTLFALAGIKILPAMQAVYTSFTQIKHNSAVVDSLYNDLHHPQNGQVNSNLKVAERMVFTQDIILDDLTFQYENADTPALKQVDVRIPRGSTVAFVGSTGSGKSTIADIIAGLLVAQSGRLLIDGAELTQDSTPSWHRAIAYVPQDVVLFDETVSANIAIGVPEEAVDKALLHSVAKTANIHDHIAEQLTKGYKTKVGEAGARLSGGQRQRIGLARALYRQPDVLILDEATSALDNLTEQKVLKSLESDLEGQTVIIIAHRLATIRHADTIYLLDDGKVVASGDFQTLIRVNEEFREMAAIA